MYAPSTASDVDLDIEYSPSLNTKRFQDAKLPNERVLENFLKITKEETERVRQKYRVKLDVRYGSDNQTGDNRLLDIYFKDKEQGSPIFVFIHGGFWQSLDKSTAGSFVAPLVERQWRVVNVDYNLCPSIGLQELCQQMLEFYTWLYNYAHETAASSIVICGHSAGAHLAALLFSKGKFEEISASFKTHKSLEVKFFLISGLFDLRELWKLECSNPENILSLNESLAAELSPICWNLEPNLIEFCEKANFRIHILAAEHDSDTFKGQSQFLAQKWLKLGLNINLKIFEGYDHFDIIEEAALENSKITSYILENIK